jgi:hypothetical protein
MDNGGRLLGRTALTCEADCEDEVMMLLLLMVTRARELGWEGGDEGRRRGAAVQIGCVFDPERIVDIGARAGGDN